MKRGRPSRCGFALVALAAALAAPAPAPAAEDDPDRPAAPAPAIAETLIIEVPAEAGVIFDPDPAPDYVEGLLLACPGMPGCRAVWQEGVGMVLILGFEPQPP